MARLFFALWPDAPAREALATVAARVAARLEGRPVPAANLHLTLAFLGEVDAARVDALEQAAGGIAAHAFTVSLDRLGGFRRAGVAWAGCRQCPESLARLQADLDARIREAGFAPDPRPFAPHLTLARRVRGTAGVADMEPVRWLANAFALVESARDRGGYRTLAEWPLQEGKD